MKYAPTQITRCAEKVLVSGIEGFKKNCKKDEIYYAFGIVVFLDYGNLDCAFAAEPPRRDAARWRIEEFKYQNVIKLAKQEALDKWHPMQRWIENELENGNRTKAERLKRSFEIAHHHIVGGRIRIFSDMRLAPDFEVLMKVIRD